MSAESKNAMFPLVTELPQHLAAVEVFQKLAHLPHVVYFDSANKSDSMSQFSFVAADPFLWMVADNSDTKPLDELENAWKDFSTKTNPQLPPFQGGAAGLFGYELASSLEHLPAAQATDFPVPMLGVGLYDVVFAFDHQQSCGWIISQGLPETESSARLARAQQRLEQATNWIADTDRVPEFRPSSISESHIAEQFDVGMDRVTSNMSADAYRGMITKAVEYIHAGDVFQVNLAQRLLSPAQCDSLELYLRLREQNAAPYAGYLDLGDWQVCSTSPECFLTVRDGEVETRPIKGTRGRFGQPEADLYAGDDLQLSEKDRAENVMIVDLMRNDLSRVCEPDSVHVAKLCQVETYAFVKHLVSVVRGKLLPHSNAFDLLRACFPGGSITGAPKIRAMEIIAELEPTARGPYCGSLAYIGFDGQMDSNILIRTVTAGHGWWQLPVGGGIVAQSQPDDEYRETWHKARGMIAGITEAASK